MEVENGGDYEEKYRIVSVSKAKAAVGYSAWPLGESVPRVHLCLKLSTLDERILFNVLAQHTKKDKKMKVTVVSPAGARLSCWLLGGRVPRMHLCLKLSIGDSRHAAVRQRSESRRGKKRRKEGEREVAKIYWGKRTDPLGYQGGHVCSTLSGPGHRRPTCIELPSLSPGSSLQCCCRQMRYSTITEVWLNPSNDSWNSSKPMRCLNCSPLHLRIGMTRNRFARNLTVLQLLTQHLESATSSWLSSPGITVRIDFTWQEQ